MGKLLKAIQNEKIIKDLPSSFKGKFYYINPRNRDFLNYLHNLRAGQFITSTYCIETFPTEIKMNKQKTERTLQINISYEN